MNEIVILYKIGFDHLENHNPEYKEEIGVFGPKDNLSAHGNCSNFISKMDPVELYLGYNGEIYPKFKMEIKYVR